ncbi:tyrosine-type recombinase/integrase [Frigoriglobus tundricola]|uniref:Tyrosine-type recombinase/integrase n=1 Tax=Frigoriglobus tundricola TaxID=2774151 RepID=A0A6M5Z7N6_9BACT|nr:tyrosine-type recombinase/integrase [Frigoriglobus tundricola]QJX01351.1 tyrosine-type recombinase/integrase [Frigoriglobus tundricola]
MSALVPVTPPLPTAPPAHLIPAVPAIVAAAGGAASYAYDEFFEGMIANPNTRTAYRHAVKQFLGWCAQHQLGLTAIQPGHVGRYMAQHPGSVATKKQHLAAIRKLFDQMVVRHAIALNPAASVRGERYAVTEGKTPMIPVEQARALIASLDVSAGVVSLRDRAVLGVLSFTAARSGAVAKLRVEDFYHDGTQWLLRFREKGGKDRPIPVRHDLEQWLREYTRAAGITEEQKGKPLFRAAVARSGRLSAKGLSYVYIWRLVKRRLKDAGLEKIFSPHSFRVKVATDLLTQGVPLEDVQHLCGHSDPRTTRIYDRRTKRVGRNLVERISG